MSKYQFGSIVDRDFRNTLQRLADDATAQGKAIQDLVAEGQLTEEQYAKLIRAINGLANKNELEDLENNFGAALHVLMTRWEQRPIPEPEEVTNLYTLENHVTGTFNENNGNINPHALNVITDYFPVQRGQTYSYYRDSPGQSKLIWYDEGKKYIAGEGWFDSGHSVFTAPDNATFVRLNIGVGSHESAEGIDITFNIGSKVMDPEDEGTIYDGGFWEGLPRPTLEKDSVKTHHISGGQVTLEKLDSQVVSALSSGRVEQPFPKTLNFKEISTGWYEVNHLSQDGKVVYFKYGRHIWQSMDDGETLLSVGSPSEEVPSVQAIRDLADGELLVSTTRDEDNNLKSKVFKSRGYDRHNPEDTEFEEVLEGISSQANIYESWGLEAHDNICLASEYGLRGDDGARHVYLSTDYGETWQMIFDQKTTTQNIDGAPTWTTSAHLHTVHYDRYFNRIWLVVGDNPNTATYYSDDMGDTWEYVRGSDEVQYTGIVSFPNGVVFGSDRNPNGLHVWYRTQYKSDEVRIEPLELINDHDAITHVFQRAFRRYDEKGEIALFPATRISDYRGEYGSVIMAMTSASKAYKIYELPADHSVLGFYNAVGVTAKGNILTSRHNGSNHTILRAKAPLFE